MSKLSEEFSFFGFLGDVEADPGGRPRFLGATLVGVVGVAVAAESAKVVVVTETDFFAVIGVDVNAFEPDSSISFGVGTTPGRSEKRTDLRGTDPDDFSAAGFRIGRVGVTVSTIWINLHRNYFIWPSNNFLNLEHSPFNRNCLGEKRKTC